MRCSWEDSKIGQELDPPCDPPDSKMVTPDAPNGPDKLGIDGTSSLLNVPKRIVI